MEFIIRIFPISSELNLYSSCPLLYFTTGGIVALLWSSGISLKCFCKVGRVQTGNRENSNYKFQFFWKSLTDTDRQILFFFFWKSVTDELTDQISEWSNGRQEKKEKFSLVFFLILCEESFINCRRYVSFHIYLRHLGVCSISYGLRDYIPKCM